MPRPKKQAPNHATGMYEYKATIGRDFQGKAIRKSFYSSKSLDEAKKKAQAYIINQEIADRTGETLIQNTYTFGEWTEKWLEVYKKPTVSENTYLHTYKGPTEKHIIPYFGKSDLKNIRNIDVQKFFSIKQNTLSQSMLEKLKIILNAIFECAIENDLCYKNPVKHAEYRSNVEKSEKQVYTDEQLKIVKPYFYTDMPEVFLLLETGLRRGEMLGLMWQDIDIAKKTLSVNRSISDKSGGGVLINPPKWDSYRTIPISNELIQLLCSLPHNSLYVFPNVNGQIAYPSHWSRKLQRHMERLNKTYPSIPILTAHELRHTRGTEMRRTGVDIYTIQKIMGHKDINVTANIYVHDDVETTRKAAKIG